MSAQQEPYIQDGLSNKTQHTFVEKKKKLQLNKDIQETENPLRQWSEPILVEGKFWANFFFH